MALKNSHKITTPPPTGNKHICLLFAWKLNVWVVKDYLTVKKQNNMIQANELRIGNYFQMDGSIYKVINVSINGFSGTLVKGASGMHTNGGRRNPILLTPEILEKCGFEKYKWQEAFFIGTVFGDLYIHFYKDKIIIRMVKVTSDSIGHKMLALPFIGRKECVDNITSLHQLQNLYFALTGTELTVNL